MTKSVTQSVSQIGVKLNLCRNENSLLHDKNKPNVCALIASLL
jgi:hypothetical protein